MREQEVLTALATVRDPELDEPITSLGFVASCSVSAAGQARVLLRLPTYFCAPNFAFLMVADAYDAVAGAPGVRSAEVVLQDHFAADPINAGVAAQAGFAASFDGEAVAELHELRAAFLRKAVMAGTDLVCRPLLAAGTTPERLRLMVLGDVPPSAELTRLRQRRAQLGLPAGDGAPLLIDPVTGAPVARASRHTWSVPAITALRRNSARSSWSSSAASSPNAPTKPARAATPSLIASDAKWSSRITVTGKPSALTAS